MLSLEELEELVKREEIDTVLMVFTDLYGRFMGKRYDAEFFLEEGAGHGTHACDYLITVDMEMEPVDGYEIANWERGYGDFHLVPEFSTLRRASWLDRTAMVICDVHHEISHKMITPASRSMLVSQIEEAKILGLLQRPDQNSSISFFRTVTRKPQRQDTNSSNLLAGTSKTITRFKGPGKKTSTEHYAGISGSQGYLLKIQKASGVLASMN